MLHQLLSESINCSHQTQMYSSPSSSILKINLWFCVFWKYIHDFEKAPKKNMFYKSSSSRCSDQGSWGSIGKCHDGVLQAQIKGPTHPLTENQCQPPQTSFVCVAYWKFQNPLLENILLRRVERAAKVVIHQVGWMVDILRAGEDTAGPRLMSTCEPAAVG